MVRASGTLGNGARHVSVRVYNQCYEVLLVLVDRGLYVPQVSLGIVRGGRQGVGVGEAQSDPRKEKEAFFTRVRRLSLSRRPSAAAPPRRRSGGPQVCSLEVPLSTLSAQLPTDPPQQRSTQLSPPPHPSSPGDSRVLIRVE